MYVPFLPIGHTFICMLLIGICVSTSDRDFQKECCKYYSFSEMFNKRDVSTVRSLLSAVLCFLHASYADYSWLYAYYARLYAPYACLSACYAIDVIHIILYRMT